MCIPGVNDDNLHNFESQVSLSGETCWAGRLFLLLGFNKAFTWLSSNICPKLASADETLFLCDPAVLALCPLLLLGTSCLPWHIYLLCRGTVFVLTGGTPGQQSESTFPILPSLTSERQRHSGFLSSPVQNDACHLFCLLLPQASMWLKKLLS